MTGWREVEESIECIVHYSLRRIKGISGEGRWAEWAFRRK